MITIPTVLVLGAGASAPFEFPTGQGLKDLIYSNTLANSGSVKHLGNIGFDRKTVADFRHALLHSGRSSVDAFLEYRNDFMEIGKAAIAITLLPFERRAALFEDWVERRLDPRYEEGNWYDYLFNKLSEGNSFDQFDGTNLRIITFNYDRSLEFYLFTALKNSYGRTDEECAEKLSTIQIVHVHGSLGDLPWQPNAAGSVLPVPYNSNASEDRVRSAAQNIKIISENTMDTAEFATARKFILQTKHLLFLGFGYHPVNMKRLLPQDLKLPPHIRGTSLGLAFDRTVAVGQRIPNLSLQNKGLVQEGVYTFLHRRISLDHLSQFWSQ